MFNREKGFASLTVTLALSSILILVTVGLLVLTISYSKRSQLGVSSNQAFYAAEGLLYDSLWRLHYLQDWPPDININGLLRQAWFSRSGLPEGELVWNSPVEPLTLTSSSGKPVSVNFLRQIWLDMDNNRYRIEIQAERDLTNRKVVGYYNLNSWFRKPLDIMLVMDTSTSMSWTEDLTSPTPLSYSKAAHQKFIQLIDYFNKDARFGLVTYGDTATLKSPLTTDTLGLISAIESVETAGITNLHNGLVLANQALPATPGRFPVIIVFSDGIPNRVLGTCIACPESPCSQNCCTKETAKLADSIKTQGKIIFTIYLSNIQNSSCTSADREADKAKTAAFGRQLLEEIATPQDSDSRPVQFFYPITDASKLDEVMLRISETISDPRFQGFYQATPSALPVVSGN